jgi:hypothetical protein
MFAGRGSFLLLHSAFILLPWLGVGFGRAVSRILSAPCGGENHLSERPIPETCRFRGRGAGRSSVSYLALHPTGFSVPRCLRFARCALTAPFHHHRRLAPEAVCFLWHCPSKRLEPFRLRVSRPNKPGLRSVAPSGVRTFLIRLRERDSPPFQNHANNTPCEERKALKKSCNCNTKEKPLPDNGRGFMFNFQFNHPFYRILSFFSSVPPMLLVVFVCFNIAHLRALSLTLLQQSQCHPSRKIILAYFRL